MNAKQATKKMDRYALVKQIADLEFVNRMNAADIKSYNQCIDYMISGGSPCEFCHDFTGDCSNPERREAGKGCEDWMLRMKEPEEVFAEKASEEGTDGNVL